MLKLLINIVIYVNWILFSIYTIVYTCLLVGSIILLDGVVKYFHELQNKPEYEKLELPVGIEYARNVIITLIIFFGMIGAVIFLMYYALNMLLTKGVNQSDREKCDLWITINSILFWFVFILMMYGFTASHIHIDYSNSSECMIYIIPNLIALAIYGNSVFIIKKFRDDLVGTVATAAITLNSKKLSRRGAAVKT